MEPRTRTTLAALAAISLGLGWAAASSSCDDTSDTTTSTTSGVEHPFCGDGVTQAELGEECDDANDADFDACLPGCKAARCGDSYVFAGVEECDDANASDADACTTACIRARCGDGFVQKGEEECDDFNEEDGDGCVLHCVAGGGCGDGIVEAGEVCDDGNHSNADFCTNACTNATCGDGYLEPVSEVCDDADANDTNACTSDCKTVSVVPAGCPGLPVGLEIDKPVTLTPVPSASSLVEQGSCGGEGAEMIYAITPIDDGLLEIDLTPLAPAPGEPPANPVIHVRTGDCAGEVNEVACANRSVAGGAERLEVAVLANQTYYVVADTVGRTEKPASAITLALTSRVAGDNCFGVPVPLKVNETRSFTGNTIAARADRRGEELCDSADTKEVIYEVIPEQDGRVFAVLTPNYDASLYVRTSCADASSQVLCAEQGASKEMETLTFNVAAGIPIYYFVDGFKGDAGAYSIDFTLAP